MLQQQSKYVNNWEICGYNIRANEQETERQTRLKAKLYKFAKTTRLTAVD